MKERNRIKSLATEGTIFMLVVSALMSPLLTYHPDSNYMWLGITFGIIYIVNAYLCWKLKPSGFLIAIILAVFVIATTIGFSPLQYPGDEFLVIIQILIVFFAFRGYREIQQK